MKNQACKLRPEVVNVNIDEPKFYPYRVQISKCSCSCNNINNPYAKLFVSDVVKSMNIEVFNSKSRNNETRHITLNETL